MRVSPTKFAYDYLAPISKTLNYLFISTILSDHKPITMYEITGRTELLQLNVLQLYLNLRNTITSNAFSNTRNVTILKLSNCEIEVIAFDAFFPLRRTLRELHLQNNKLATLPTGILSYLLPSKFLKISLFNNPWHCECQLLEFQGYLIANRLNFLGLMTCATPTKGVDVTEANICDWEIDHLPESKHLLTQECIGVYPTEFVKIRKRDTFFKLVRENLTLTAVHENEYSTNEIFLFWNGSVANSTKYASLIDCKMFKTKNVHVNNNLQHNEVYVTCLMHTQFQVISVQNCVSYYHRRHQKDIWLTYRQKNCVYISIVVIMILCLTIGAFMYFIQWNMWSIQSANNKTINSRAKK